MPRTAPWCLVAACCSIACGGSTRDGTSDDPDHDSTTTSADDSGASSPVTTGGSSSGGISSTGGASGSSTGGLSSTGGASGTEAGPDRGPVDVCALPVDTRACDGGPVIVHDPATKTCTNLGSQSCPNNDNSFGSIAECLATCSGSRPDTTVCDVASDCEVASAGCCEPCAPANASAFIAVNRERLSDVERAMGCDGVRCGSCTEPDGASGAATAFEPNCLNGICAVVDTRPAIGP